MPSKIPTHRPSTVFTTGRHRHYDRTRRDAEAKRFYHSIAWLKLRLIQLADTPYCELCYQRDELVEATHVHHKVEIVEDPDLRLDPDNLQSLCHSCHSRLHRSRKVGHM